MSISTPPDSISACHRVLTAIRQYRREHGCAPSLGEIARRARVRRQHVGRYLLKLQADRHLTYDRASPEPIRLTDPAANLSDLDLELGCQGRGWTIVKSKAPVIATAFPLDRAVPHWELPLLCALSHTE